jgi:hypothetical protein
MIHTTSISCSTSQVEPLNLGIAAIALHGHQIALHPLHTALGLVFGQMAVKSQAERERESSLVR